MANGDNILVRLLLNTGDFDVKLGKAKKEIDGFGSGIGKMGSVAGGALKGLAGAAGIAFGAMETFDRIIVANETNNDKWENTVRAMNNSVNEFFSALTSGDFSGFQNGLDGIIRKAQETAEALRQIDDAQTVFGLFSTENRAAFNEALVTIKDKNASPEAISAAKSSVEEIIKTQTEQSIVLAEKAINAARNIIAQRGNMDAADITEADIKDMLSIALDAQGGIRDESLAQKYEEYVSKYKDLRARYSEIDMTTGRLMFMGGADYNQELRQLNNTYSSANLYNALWNKTNGSDLKQLVSFLQSAYSARSEIASMQRTYNRATQGGGEDRSNNGNTVAEGSIDWYNQEIASLNEVINSTTDMNVRIQAQKTVNEYKAQLDKIKTEVTNAASGTEPVVPLENPGGINIGVKAETSMTGGLVMPEIETPDMSDQTSQMENYANSIDKVQSSLGSLSGVMGILTGTVDEQTASWLNYGIGIVQAVTQALPAIVSLITTKQAEATANTAAAASGAGSAVASIPYVGPAMAVAAIASIIAALASLPKFAEGGVVGGSSYYGDRILARVNSGEVILNRNQQGRLLSQMERPSQDVHVFGDFRIAGRDLRLVLDKYDTYRRQ